MGTLHLTIDFLETETVSVEGPSRGESLGTVYASPYGRLNYDAFAARVAQELVHELGAESVHAAEAYSLYVLLTPYLPDGAGVFVLSQRDRRLDVAAALDPGEWKRADVATKRVLLLDRAASCIRSAQWPMGADLDAAVARACAAYPRLETQRAALAAQGARPVSREVLAALSIDAWTVASAEARRGVIDSVARVHPELGAATLDTSARVSFADPHAPFRWQLVLGRRYPLGFSAETWTKARAWCAALRDGDESSEIWLHGSDAPCDVLATGQVALGPFLIADVCLPGPPPEAEYPWIHAWASLDWRGALAQCLAHAWSLPTMSEMACAAAGGVEQLFPWGDDATPIVQLVTGMADELAEAYGLDTPTRNLEQVDPLEVFAGTNRLGLVAPLSERTWCLPDLADMGTPHRAAGGAMGSFPWQGGWESAAFFPPAHHRWGIDLGFRQARVRPVLRFAVDDSAAPSLTSQATNG